MRCIACGKSFHRMGSEKFEAFTADGQRVRIGPDCWKKTRSAKSEGYEPPAGGPRIYLKSFAPVNVDKKD